MISFFNNNQLLSRLKTQSHKIKTTQNKHNQLFGCLIPIAEHQAITPTKHYDFIFVGLGASASLTLLALHKYNLLENKSILIIEPEAKNINDKTYCFWAAETDYIVIDLKPIISKSWTSVSIAKHSNSPLQPIQYWQISSIHLYKVISTMIADYNWERMAKTVEVVHTNQNHQPYIEIDNQTLSAGIIFDSRNPHFHQAKNFETHLWQSFVGWKIKTEESAFNPSDFKMMDFATPQDNYTQFVYVLPYSDREALVEITRFGQETFPPDLAELRLAEYLEKLNISYTITDTEIGCIPMSNVETGVKDIPGVINLGSRANVIKPSTGYAFKSMHAHAQKIARSIQQPSEKSILTGIHSQGTPQVYPSTIAPTPSPTRFKFYDSLLLKILEQQPHWGKPIFEQLFNRVNIPRVMQFLDEKTTIVQDIHILRKLPFKPFLSVLFKHPTAQSVIQPICLLLLTATLIFLGDSTAQTVLGNTLLIAGLIAIGIPHGAVDHLLETKQWNNKTTPWFIFNYLLIGGLFALTWMIFPNWCLVFFLFYSAWHFGQADGEHWGMSNRQNMGWGATVLTFILLSHATESAEIISGITVISNTYIESLVDTFQLVSPIIFGIFLIPWIVYSIKKQLWGMNITILWLIASISLPLLWSFGLYFIGQHSYNGWHKIKNHLRISHRKLWLQSLPFHLGAWCLLGVFYILFNRYGMDSPLKTNGFNIMNSLQNINPQLSSWAPFFVFLACISLPHVWEMHKLYIKNKHH